MKKLAETYKDKVVVIGVTKDEGGGKKFKEKHGLGYEIWVDSESALFDRFVDMYIPWNVIVDGEGKLRYSKVGFEEDEIKKVLDELTKK